MQSARLELPGDRARTRQLAAGLAEHRADLGRSPVAVVGLCLDENRHAPRPVPLVHDLLELGRLTAAGGLVDRPLDVVGGHVHRARLLDGEPQPVVGVGVAATLPRGHRDLAGDLREKGASLGVGDAFRALDRGPLGMTGHRGPEYSRLSCAGPLAPPDVPCPPTPRKDRRTDDDEECRPAPPSERRPGRPRRSRQDDARRTAHVQGRGDPPSRARGRRDGAPRLRTRGAATPDVA